MDKKQRLKAIAHMAANSTSRNKILASDKIIGDNVFNIYANNDVHIDIHNDWKTKSNTRKLRRDIHTHIFLMDFTSAYNKTKDIKYFEESIKLLINWFETFPIEDRNNIEDMAYHDEGTSIRLMIWLKYYYQFFDLFSSEQVELLEKNMNQTAKLLKDPEFYSGMNNHGMFQDLGSLAYSIFSSSEGVDNENFERTFSRLVEYFKGAFTEEGVHKEHSPYYHILILHSLKQMIKALDNIGYIDQRLDYLKNIFHKGEEYIISITLPNFKTPNISDGSQINLSTSGIYRDLFDSEEYKYITSGGKEGVFPEKLLNIYPESGYLVARDSWKTDSLYFLFLASYHMHYHKHTDDLSFILYKNGPIFVDAGPHSYDYKNPYTLYAYSQFAHSTLVVNNKSNPRTDYKFDKVSISDYSIDKANEEFTVSAINSRNEDVNHIRTIDGNIKEELFIIKDKMNSPNSNQYKILFQIHHELDIVENGKIISIFKNNAKVAELEISGIEGEKFYKTYVVNSQEFPQIMGYSFPKIDSIEPLKTLVVELYNDSSYCSLTSTIRLKDFKLTGNNNFSKRHKMVKHREVSYVYEDNGNNKLAVIFSATENNYNYKIDEFPELLEGGYNLLYLLDNQATAGRSFIDGVSPSTIEADVLTVINKIINRNNYQAKDVYFIGRFKGGYAALLFGLTSGFDNIIVSTPLAVIGDYYTRHSKYENLLDDLGFTNDVGTRHYLTDYLLNCNISSVKNLQICVGENDYNKPKHIEFLSKWLNDKNIDYVLHEYPGAKFSDDKKEFLNFLSLNIMNKEED